MTQLRESSISRESVKFQFPWAVVDEVVSKFGTPLYIYFPELLKEAYTKFKLGTKAWGRAEVAYSLKTNPLPALLRDLRALGAWVETVSTWEQQIAERAGFAPAQMIFNGPLKTPEDLRNVAHKGLATINIDSLEELEIFQKLLIPHGSKVNVGIRLCPSRVGGSWSRFGLQVETGEAELAARAIIADPRYRLACVHFHLGTQIQDSQRFLDGLDQVQELWQRLDLRSDVWLDIGGGYPFQHDRLIDAQDFDPFAFFQLLSNQWRIGPRPPLLLEPGRIIAAPAAVLLGRVLAIKSRLQEPAIVVLDAGTNQNVMGAFYEHTWLSRKSASDISSYRFCGPLCMEDDLMSGERSGTIPAVGELVAMLNSGAYSMSLGRSFIQPTAAVVQIAKDGTASLIKPRESLQDMNAAK